MKRSEMLERVSNIIKEHQPCCEPKDIAELILQKIEFAGMLPPRTKLDKLNLEDNAWDPEDNNGQRN